MLKAQKLGPQSFQDFLKQQLPSYVYTRPPLPKDQAYWSTKDTCFTRFTAQIITDQMDQSQMKDESTQENRRLSDARLQRNKMRRTLLEFYSGQRKSEAGPEFSREQVVLYSPVHLVNNVDNSWNHLELTDKKHLNFICGSKSIERQRKGIKMIGDRLLADKQVDEMRLKARSLFRYRRVGRLNLNDAVDNSCNYQQMEFRNMILTEMQPLDQFNSNILFKQLGKHAIGVKQRKANKQYVPQQRSKSLQSQPSDGGNLKISDDIEKFENHLKTTQCNYLKKRIYDDN